MKPRHWTHSIASLFVLAAVPAVLTAAPAAEVPQVAVFETLNGKIRSVGEESFVVMVGEEARTVPISETTKYLLDGKEARKEQVLKVGQEVSVTMADGSATQVSGRSTPDALALETLNGKIRSVGEESFVVMVGEEAKTVPVSERTKYLLDGKEVRKDQVLKVGHEVSVTVAEGAATQVSCRSTPGALVSETINGSVRSIGEGFFVLMVETEAKTIRTDESTRYFLDGKEARKDLVLQVGKTLSVDLAEGTASKVSGRSNS